MDKNSLPAQKIISLHAQKTCTQFIFDSLTVVINVVVSSPNSKDIYISHFS
jgi:hypothetical protein